MIEANEPPSRTEGSGTFRLATYNVRSGRNGGLESALRAMDSLGVDIGLFQETKLTGDIYTRFSSGYSVIASDAPIAWSGEWLYFTGSMILLRWRRKMNGDPMFYLSRWSRGETNIL